MIRFPILISLGLLISATGARALGPSETYLVQLREGAQIEDVLKGLKMPSGSFRSQLLSPLLSIYALEIEGTEARRFLRDIKRYPHWVSAVERDRVLTPRGRFPNDPDLGVSWALSPPTSKISAPEAWGVTTGGRTRRGSDIVVAMLDDGLDTDHPDLTSNFWKNDFEIDGNSLDDDGNGYIDDVRGWNPEMGSDHVPASDHGTAVASVVGARGNNGLGLSGVNWSVKIMPVVVLPLTTSRMIQGLNYILTQKRLWWETQGQRGANIVAINMSFGLDRAQCTRAEFPLWNGLFDELGRLGILTVAATTNLGLNVDFDGDVPTGCASRYLVTVTATDRYDEKPMQAGFGRNSIDLGAPGVGVAVLEKNQWAYASGTSYAAPFVSGAVGLMHAAASYDFLSDLEKNPARGADLLKAALLASADRVPDLASWSVSGGRLNLGAAVRALRDYRSWKSPKFWLSESENLASPFFKGP